MKSLAITLILILCYTAESQQQDQKYGPNSPAFLANKTICLQEYKVKDELIQKALKDREFADDRDLKCYFKCMHIRMGHMNDAGVVNLTSMKENIPPFLDKNQALGMLTKCDTVTGSEPCDIAVNLQKCLNDYFKLFKGRYQKKRR